MREPCPKCGKGKLVNRVKPESVEKIRGRQTVRVQIGSERHIPVMESLVHETRVIGDPPVESVFWYWEGRVQHCIVEHLIKSGYGITRVSDTKSRESGKDIEAASPQGKTLWLTVKGYPHKSAHTQARHWFAESLFDLVLYREGNDTVEFGIGLPEGFATYRNLANRVTWFKKCVPFRFYWVQEDGTVRVE
jgi:hypothetical protein